MNLQELKQSIRLETDMSNIYSEIKIAALNGRDYATFRCELDYEEITEMQIEVLREQGYTVYWNRPCLWYEVGGWK